MSRKTAFVYKLGLEFYNGILDKNAGIFESNLIKSNLANLFDLSDINEAEVIIVICGAKRERDQEVIDRINSKKATKIFIQTDATLSKPRDLKVDYILTQNTKHKNHHDEYYYSYIPELFYTATDYEGYDLDFEEKIDSILFAGALDGREETVKRFSQSENTLVIAKDKKSGYDNRLPYREYIKLASTFKYHFICHEPIFNLISWVTPRIVEAVKLNSIPILEPLYDISSHFVSEKSNLRLSDDDIWDFKNINPDRYIEDFIKLKEDLEYRQYKFLELIDNLIYG